MLKHIVLWKFKTEAEGNTASENILIAKEKLEGLLGEIPEILDIQVLPNTLSGVGNYDAALVATFQSVEELVAYQKNPLHVEVAKFVGSVTETRAALDYED